MARPPEDVSVIFLLQLCFVAPSTSMRRTWVEGHRDTGSRTPSRTTGLAINGSCGIDDLILPPDLDHSEIRLFNLCTPKEHVRSMMVAVDADGVSCVVNGRV